MTSANLENLAKIGQLKREPPAHSEFDGLVKSARRRLKDANNPSNELESRFDLAYNAAHALALAALRWHGYRSESRNRFEYEGILDINERLLAELIDIAGQLLRKVEALGPVAG